MTKIHPHPLMLDLRSLGRHPGEQIVKHLDVAAPAELVVGMIGVPEGSPVAIDLTCQSAGDGVFVQGVVAVTLTGQCARCLTEFTRGASFDLQELYFYPGRGPQPGQDDDDEVDDALFVVDDFIDLDPALREAVVLSLPFSPLCRDDCAGLCTICGADLNKDPGHSHDEPVDARWAKLGQLR
ncbi:MAG: DUF177 domain-containing protein [Propionibacteriaceae bacterium]|nr:DUF177 domain-containing protein [Propionibacteriaceae bacterium]